MIEWSGRLLAEAGGSGAPLPGHLPVPHALIVLVFSVVIIGLLLVAAFVGEMLATRWWHRARSPRRRP
jgi:hypothetical protein